MRNTPPTRLPNQLDSTNIDRLGYADNVDLCGEHLPSIEETYVQFRNNAERTGMTVNNAKTKIMEVSRTPNLVGDVDFGRSQLEAVTTFKYFGSTITSLNLIQEEVRLKIAAGTGCSWALDTTFRSRILSRVQKHKYTTIIRPVILYGCETWPLTKQLKNKFEVFQRSILRWIWGPIWDDEAGEWRRRHNNELIALSGLPPISNVIRSHRLRYAGHIARMEESRLTRRVMLGKPIGTRPRGRPRKRWMDNVTEDLDTQEINCNEWIDRIFPGQSMQGAGDGCEILHISPVIPCKTKERADFSGGFGRWNLLNGREERRVW